MYKVLEDPTLPLSEADMQVASSNRSSLQLCLNPLHSQKYTVMNVLNRLVEFTQNEEEPVVIFGGKAQWRPN